VLGQLSRITWRRGQLRRVGLVRGTRYGRGKLGKRRWKCAVELT
jgi:hypothetical protein